ncbi:trypsin-like serine protease [Kitasatospora herbaricolor]|uniref:trypsin-like serine protease n=2 Tax=Kitasatospora herbaricolor TaxID=68217 RepID=UPI0036D90FCA
MLLLAALLAVPGAAVSIPASAAEPEAPPAVETFGFPDAAKVLAEQGATLKSGDGNIKLADCASGTGLLRVRYTGNHEICFKVTGTSGYLSMEIPAVFRIMSDGHAVKATMSAAGATSSVDLIKNEWKEVGVGANGPESMLLDLTATDGTPTTVPAPEFPAVGSIAIGAPGRAGSRACTATLVDPLWVLTSAGCFTDTPAGLAAGAPPAGSTFTAGGHSVDITELVPRTDRDVVMARLATKVSDIAPAKSTAVTATSGADVKVAGFGRTATGWGTGNGPRTTNQSVGAVTGTTVGVAPASGAAPVCAGDSGAPVLNTAGEITGVVSRAWQAGCLGTPTSETRTDAQAARTDNIASWIQDVRSRTIEIKPGTHLFAIGSEGSTYGLDVNYTTGAWGTSWTRLDGTSLKAITSVTTGSTVRLYAVGTDGRVYSRDGVTGGYWSAWMEIPGALTGAKAITASVTGGNKVHVQVIGADGMYNQDADYAAGTWSVWTKMDSTNLKAITSAVTGNTAHIYAVNEDNKVYTRDANYDVGWGNWVEVPGGLTGAKAITASVTGGTSVHVQVIGADGMYNQDANYAGGGWTTWTKMDSTHLSAITSTVTGNTAHIYAVNEDTQLYTRDADYSVGWGTWANVPGGAAGLKGITATTSG